MTTTASGLQFEDTVPGSGDTARAGHHVTVHYTGWLHDASAPQCRGRKFDSSKDRGDPFDFALGDGQVIQGWDEGVQAAGRRHPRSHHSTELATARAARRRDSAQRDARVRSGAAEGLINPAERSYAGRCA